MPSGKIRWFDANRGYGFISGDDGKDVFLPAAALPSGITTVRKGTKVEYSEVDGRKGLQAMSVQVIGPKPSVVAATRPKPDDMAAIVEDLIKLLDLAGGSLRRHHYPSSNDSRKLAKMLRAVADDFDIEE
ncbi:MAG: cold shock domain-containing protein [Aeriscardovia sp.]|nr:cold shock domain-containing protein [Aeriscardovia sp.]MBQ9687737.1 cold shock domain-containing protein [Aeriscardovia sp.]MBR2556637.1 cold shock domain-containing protein [Aeriscardovia sp.]MBR3359484.1 cold shock domain-containing protein [Aeriscardovia sp.]MBR4414252.1 cold shock domain-containing protein [Aeriscardovia sp.]